MSPRLIAFSILVILVLMPHGCSENTSTQPEEELPFESTFDFEYETDDALAASVDVTPAGGQSLDCTGSDGTSFSLFFAPGVVSQTTTVTVTPLKYLRVIHNTEGAGAPSRTASDTLVCNTGALFEPDGLELDSTVVLTVTFPDTAGCGVTDGLRVIHIDPGRTFYSIVPTDVDVGGAALACTLSHFSIYGTDDPDYEYLKTLIKQTTEYGLEFPGMEVVTDLVHCMDEATLGGWDDLEELALAGAHQVLKKYAPIPVKQAEDDLTHASMLELVRVIEKANLIGAAEAVAILDAGIRSVIDKMIARGRWLCGTDKAEEGRAFLTRAWNYFTWGLTDFPDNDAKETEIKNALNACSDLRITVVSYKPVIYDLALTEDSENTYTDFEVEVLNHTMDPMEGEDVELTMSHVGDPHYDKRLDVQTTDSDGVAWFRFGYGGFDMPEGRYVLIATVYYGGEINSGLGSVELKRILVTLNYEYTNNYNRTTGDGYYNLAASFTSSGTRAVRGGGAWDCPEVARSLTHSSSSGGGQYTSTHTLLPPHPNSCFFQIYHRFVYTDDEYHTQIWVLNKLSVAMHGPTLCTMERVETGPGYTDTDIVTQDAIEYFSMPYPSGDEYHEVLLDYGGGFEDYTFEYVDPDGYGSASLTITAKVKN